jgi:4-diphosphocytidyl-2-C-methyl-D-erythritol kinase
MPSVLTEAACAKVNLALRILSRRHDGFHELDSIVAFADIADRVTLAESDQSTFSITGPFSAKLTGSANSVQDADVRLRATLARLGMALPMLAITLEKNLPVASGIGGGSADAAAFLRGAQHFLPHPLPETDLAELALSLGADVPVCLLQKSCRMQGIGERLLPFELRLPRHILLANPLVSLVTKDVFAALGLERGQRLHDAALPDNPALWHNDLAEPAIRLVPAVSEILTVLEAESCFEMVRMSGSGATCFGLSDNAEAVQRVADRLSRSHPDWWVKTGQIL